MGLTSLNFVFFLTIICGIYFGVPRKLKNLVLLVASYYFYLCNGIIHAVVLALISVITYIAAYLIYNRKNKILLWFSLGVLFALLLFFKYESYIIAFIEPVISVILVEFDLGSIKNLIPLGMSFYTLQAAGYLIDIYQGKVELEKNFIIYALFMSFFPYAVSGPIERAGKMFKQFHEEHHFDYIRACHGLQLFIYGGG